MRANHPKLGKYRHYKGQEYRLIGVAKHSETLEDLVVYEALYQNKVSRLWVRPLTMFTEQVQVNGQKIFRFEYLGEYNNREQIIEKLTNLLPSLNSGDPIKVENTALEISSSLIGWEENQGYLEPIFLEIKYLALDLEIPQNAVKNYDSKLLKLKDLIKSL